MNALNVVRINIAAIAVSNVFIILLGASGKNELIDYPEKHY
jgi:hypothetical protein